MWLHRCGFPGGAAAKNPPANTGDLGFDPLGQEELLEEEMATHSSILPWKSHGQRSLEGYSHKELDTTE